MNGLEFLDLLDRSGLVSQVVIEKLRSQVTDRTDVQRIVDLLDERGLVERADLIRMIHAAEDAELTVVTEEDLVEPDSSSPQQPPDLFEEAPVPVTAVEENDVPSAGDDSSSAAWLDEVAPGDK